jgi:hypothetical protein
MRCREFLDSCYSGSNAVLARASVSGSVDWTARLSAERSTQVVALPLAARFCFASMRVATLLVGICAVVTGGTVKPHEAAVAVLVNQVGYDSQSAKTLVVQIRDPQPGDPSTFHLVTEGGEIVYTGKLIPRGRVHEGTASDWGARYWTGDFTRFKRAGHYRACVPLGSKEVSSFLFRIGKHVLFLETAEFAARFFYWQRCGFAIPGIHAACHLDDGKLTPELGGGYRDVAGGWHDAGDYNKYNGYTPAAVYSLAVLAHDPSRLFTPQARRRVLEEAVWGGEFVYKMWQPGKGIMYHEVYSGWAHWGLPEKETDNIPGNADDRPIRGQGPNPMAAAAMAALARASGQAKYREAAEDLWRGAEAARAEASPHMLLADLELHQLTGDNRYREGAVRRAESILKLQTAHGLWQPDIGEYGIRPAALALYARAYPKDVLSKIILAALRRWLERSLQIADNPFQLTPYSEGVFFRPYADQKTWYVGQNTQYLSQAWALYLAGHLLHDSRARQMADRQIDWVLGTNPLILCMMEGKGSYNLPLYHHRYSGNSRRKMPGIPGQERGAIPGAIPNGVCRPEGYLDKPFVFFGTITTLPPAPPPIGTTEPWLPHNAYYLQAITAKGR